jgi:multidrug efflux pump subunit AcrA (membrane-fusion protein)
VAGGRTGTDAGAVQAYEVTTTDHGLRPGQRVYIRLPRPDRDKLHKTIPYSAIIYDRNGQSWVFTNPEPNVYVRSRIDVDSIEGRRAFLKEGPPLGTKVVTAGSAELMGVEQKFGQ